MTEQSTQFIEIGKLMPHKDNPRKDLGDLFELSESIKAKGILQNLTVVPYLGEISGQPTGFYTVIIGHRRMAAAKLAGLKQVPCVITEMNEIEQVATMLLENMQRNDLTLIEQANGFQMMIDLGDTVNNISDKTGLSEATIKRRVKLTELDQNKLIKAMERGATLMDFAELEKIKNLELKNKVLESIGTNNFKWELSAALDKESEPERKAALIDELSKFATQTEDKSNLLYVANFHSFKMYDWFKTPTDSDTVKYYFVIENAGICLYKESLIRQDKEDDRKRIAYKEKLSKLAALSDQAYEMRYDFVKGFTGAKKYSKEISEFAMHRLLGIGYGNSTDEVLEFLGLEELDSNDYSEVYNAMRKSIMEKYAEKPEYIMLVTVYCGLDSEGNRYYQDNSWEMKTRHTKNSSLDCVYETLTKLGYIMSDDERALQDGTHELFKEIEEGDN